MHWVFSCSAWWDFLLAFFSSVSPAYCLASAKANSFRISSIVLIPWNVFQTLLPVVVGCLFFGRALKNHSQLTKFQKYKLFLASCFQTIRAQELKVFRLVIYNLVNIPLIIDIVWSIRRLLVEESVKNTSFLWVPVRNSNFN